MRYQVLLAILFSGMLALSQASSLLGFSPPQTSTVSSTQDPRAVAIATQSLSAVAGQVPLTDITLQGTVTYTAGSDTETGTATLEATNRNESRVTLNLSDGLHEWIRKGPAGVWSGPDGQTHAMALHNGWTDAAWFYPALSLEETRSDPQMGLAYASAAAWHGISAQHIQLSRLPPGQSAYTTGQIQRLSRMDLYLDASSSLPLALDFEIHAKDNANLSVPFEIRFSNYQVMGGARIPIHIQEYIENTLTLDIQVTSAQLNTGILDSHFTAQGMPEEIQ